MDFSFTLILEGIAVLGIMGAIQGAITTIGNLIIGVQTVNAPLSHASPGLIIL